MARYWFGGGVADFSLGTVTVSGTANLAQMAGGATVTFWTAEVGGSQYTDFLDSDGAPATAIESADGTVARAAGQIPPLQGPDEVQEMWASANDGPRALLVGRHPSGSETTAGAQAKADAAQAAAQAASLPLTDFRPRGNRVAFIGDSITVGGQGGQAPDFANNLLGDSFPTYAMLLSGGQILHAVNAGISSNTTTAMLARLQADVISKAPDVCVILGGTNDNGANNPGVTDPAALAAITKANITAMVNQLLAAKILPVLCTLPPTSQVGDQKRYNIVNQMVRRLASTRRLPVVDFYSILVSPANGFIAAGKNFDAVHPNKYGYRDMGQAVATALANVLPPWRPWLAEDNVDTSGLFGNNLFMTDTNADGIPDAWGASGTATNYTRSLVTDPNFIGKAAQNVGAPGASGASYFSAGPSLAAVNTGDILAFSGVVSLSGGDANGAAVQIRSQFLGSAGAPADLLHVRFGADVTRGVFYGECPKPAGATSVSLWLALNGVGTAKFGQVSIHNLTALGVV